MSSEANLADDLLMAVSGLRATSTTLEFTYTVANKSTHRAYLINQLFHRRGEAGFQVDPNLVYAGLSDDKTLCLRKQCVMVPPHIKVEAPEVPYATPVAAGGRFSETVRLSLPVEPRDPYESQPRGVSPTEVSRVVFVLGYVLVEQPLSARRVTLPSGKRHWRLSYQDLFYHQRLKVSDSVEIQVPTIIARPTSRGPRSEAEQT